MVNITSVVKISSDVVITFPGFDSWWRHILSNATNDRERNDRNVLKRNFDDKADSIALKYGLSRDVTKNICFIFGCDKKAEEKLEDYETRAILCDPRSIIILQLRATTRETPGKTIIIASVHLNHIFKSIVTISERGLGQINGSNINPSTNISKEE